MSQAGARIRQAVKRTQKSVLWRSCTITVPVLAEAFYSLKSDVSAGVDGEGRCMLTVCRIALIYATACRERERRPSGG